MTPPQITWDDHAIPHIHGTDPTELMWGLGYCHASDRGMQMLLMRILGQGRGSESLESSDGMLQTDLFFRRMNWNGACADEAAKLTASARGLVEAYCEGVNARFGAKTPWELRLIGYRHEPWKPGDCVLIARMVGYLTLVQSQAEIERLLVEMVQARVERARLDELFPGILEGLDEELLRKVRLRETVVPASVKWNPALARMMASNNWVISGKRSASGKPMLANDPHLEANRLPNVWYEAVLISPNRYGLGATMPGLPGLLIGRTNDVAWGSTYPFMDALDSWVEHCKDGKFRRETVKGDQWIPFRQRRETILRKKKPPYIATFYENEHGTADGDPHSDEYILATRWSGANAGATSIENMSKIWDATTAQQAMSYLGRIEMACSWVIADRLGNIAYQMSGLMPRRREGARGFVPLPGWKTENDWDGYVDYHELPQALNPEAGFFVTANNDLNSFGSAKPINMPMGDYRARRIEQMLSTDRKLGVKEFSAMHYDVYSLQAEQFMKVLAPLLPDSRPGRILIAWDFSYAPESEGAYLFEQVYRALLREVFGGALGGAFEFLATETGTFVDFYHAFDRVILSERSAWFGGRTREQVWRAAIDRGLEGQVRCWGEVQKIMLSNILLGGKLPRFLGFDRGPVTIRGGRATVHQGQLYRSGNRATSFIPSFRMITDLAEDVVHTNMSGGPSDRRFSKWYCSDIHNWLNCIYKSLRP